MGFKLSIVGLCLGFFVASQQNQAFSFMLIFYWSVSCGGYFLSECMVIGADHIPDNCQCPLLRWCFHYLNH